jgi:TRAP-type C4-dicarboxylate transport system permease small subunit
MQRCFIIAPCQTGKDETDVNHLEKAFLKTEKFLAGILFSTMIILVTFGAITRTIGHPIIWVNDIAQLLFLYSGLLGSDIVMKAHGHIGLDLLTRYLSDRMKRGFEFFAYLIIFSFLTYFAYLAVMATMASGARTYLGLRISYKWAIGSVAGGCALMALSVLFKLPGMAKGIFLTQESGEQNHLCL